MESTTGSSHSPLPTPTFAARSEAHTLYRIISLFDNYYPCVNNRFFSSGTSIKLVNSNIEFSVAYTDTNFASMLEENSLPLIDLCLIRRLDKSIRKWHHKAIWNAWCDILNSYTSIRCKSNLYCGHYRKNCQILPGYLHIVKFIWRIWTGRAKLMIVLRVGSKLFWCKHHFKGYIAEDGISRVLGITSKVILSGAKSRCASPILQCRKEISHSSWPNRQYFTNSSGSPYVDRTERQLSKFIKDHNPR